MKSYSVYLLFYLAYGKSVSFWKGEEQQSPLPRKGEAISKLRNDRSTLDSSDCENDPDAYTIEDLNVTYISSPPSYNVFQAPYQICTKYFSPLLTLPQASAYRITASSSTNIEYYYDKVVVHEGSREGAILARTSFVHLTEIEVIAPTGIVILFDSDYSVVFDGIDLTVEVLPSISTFPTEIEQDDGSVLIETNHPYSDFDNFISHVYTFSTSYYHLVFDDLHATESAYDFMRVYAGNGSTSDSLLYYRSGIEGSWPDVTLASTIGISVVFQSDYSIQEYGLKFRIMPVESLDNTIYRDHIYSMDNLVYSTLADVQVESASSGNDQAYYIQLPEGWVLAQDQESDANVRNVIKEYLWDTYALVLANGNAIGTKKLTYKQSHGEVVDTNALLLKPNDNSSSYKCLQDYYFCQIMIVQSDSSCGPYSTQEMRVLHSAVYSEASASVWSPHPIHQCSDYTSSLIQFDDAVAYLITFDSNTTINEQDRLNIYDGIDENARLLFTKGGGKYDATGNLNWVSSVVGSTNGIRAELFSRYSSDGEWGVNMSIIEVAMLPIYSHQLPDNSYMVNSPHPYERNTYYVSDLVISNQASQIGKYHRSGKKLTEEVYYDLSFGALTSVNAGYDYLNVYNGEGTSGNLLFSYSGGANEWPSHVVVNSAVGITAVLQTDYKDPKEGLYLTIAVSSNSYVQDRIHTVLHLGRVYSSLSDINPYGGPYNSQPYPLVIPPGWSVAEDDKNSRFVASNSGWNTEVLVFANGKAYTTASMDAFSGRYVEISTNHINSVVSPDGTDTSYNCIERMYRCQILIIKDNEDDTISSSGSHGDAIDTTTIIIIVFMCIFLAVMSIMFVFRKKVNACIDGCIYGNGGAGVYGGIVETNHNTNQNGMVASEPFGDVIKGPMSGGMTVDPVATEIGKKGFANYDLAKPPSNTSFGRVSTAPAQARVVRSARDALGASPATTVTAARRDGETAPVIVQATAITRESSGGGENMGSEWMERYSTTYNRKFWKNSITGKSTWIDPFLPQPPPTQRPPVTVDVVPPVAPIHTSTTSVQNFETLAILASSNDEDEEVELVL